MFAYFKNISIITCPGIRPWSQLEYKYFVIIDYSFFSKLKREIEASLLLYFLSCYCSYYKIGSPAIFHIIHLKKFMVLDAI